MKAKLTKLESIVQGYVAKDSVNVEDYRYLQENMETVLYAIQQFSKVEEMQKTLEWYAESNIKDIFDDMGDRAREALKGGETK